jgi:small nuclear ribonucleoprotein (snRNP)-like protein
MAAAKKRAKPDPWKRLLKRKVLVSLKTGGSFEGVLWERNAEFVVLRAAKYAPSGIDESKRVDGDAVIDLDNVDYWQFSKGTGIR